MVGDWSISTPANGQSLFSTQANSVAYGNGYWVAVGQGTNTMMYTADPTGKTGWTPTVTQFVGGSANAVAFSSGKWVAVGTTSTYNFLVTSDPTGAWTTGTLVDSLSNNIICNGVANDGGTGWVIVGHVYYNASYTARLFFNGNTALTNWIENSDASITTRNKLFSVKYGNSTGVAVGDDSDSGGLYSIIKTSNRTSAWTKGTNNFAKYGIFYGVAYGNNNWVFVGDIGNPSTIMYTQDFTTWNSVTGTVFSAQGQGVVYGNGVWVATGGNNLNTILSSTNLTTWTKGSGTIFSSGIYGQGIGFDGTNTLIAVGGGTNPILNALVSPPCFLEGSKILTDKGYVPIENIRKGDMVKTVTNTFIPVESIGVRKIRHSCLNERIGEQLYTCSTKNYPELFEDLVITGHHSLLVKEFTSKEQRDATEKVLGNIYVTDEYYRLPACVDSKTDVYPVKGEFNIYHLALENDNYYENYGVYANGLLVETTSKRYLHELSGMTLLD